MRGLSDGNILRFLGIPYAAAPVGALRFQPPQGHAGWSGERAATQPGPSAPQRLRQFPALDLTPLVDGGGERGDEYLTLNIWAPKGAKGKPVAVFIHGGAFQIGSKDAPVHDGSGFARSGLISIAINYRLGIDGFLPIEGAATNIALRDMMAALRWIRDNAEAFGGDPDNVTVFGESSGAMSIACLMASPLAQGLFNRAIVMSGHGGMVRSMHVGKRIAAKLARYLRITADVKGFGAAPIDAVLDAVEKLGKPGKLDLRDTDGFDPVFGMSLFAPIVGDDVLPLAPLAALAGGAGRDVNLLIGTCAEEMNLYFVPTRVHKRMIGLLARWIVSRSMPNATAALKAYGLGRRKSGLVLTEALTDLVFRAPCQAFAAAHQGETHVYEMDWRSPACDGELGACHGIDLPFAFDSLQSVSGPKGMAGEQPPQDLAERIHGIWCRFATDGDLPWPNFDTDGRHVFSLCSGKVGQEQSLPAVQFLPSAKA